MPRVQRSAEVVWEGNVARGNGRIAAASGAFAELPYTLASRVAEPEGKTSPEELLAAAHAGCFAMSLAGELVGAGATPDRVRVTATVTLDEVEGEGHQVVGSEIRATAAASGVDADGFQAAVQAAHAGCPFSALLVRAGARVPVNAELEG